MKIEVHITEASPEDLKVLFGNSPVLELKPAKSVQLKPALIVEEYSNKSLDKPPVRVIEDKREENLARAVIPDDLKEVKKDKKIINFETWLEGELKALDDNPSDFDTALEAFRKVSPNSMRTPDAVKQRWRIRINLAKKSGKSLKKPVEPVIAPSTNTSAKPDELVVDAPKEKPESEKWLSNLKVGWEDAEMLVIQDLPDWRDAVASYELKFGNKRSRFAVQQQWKKIAAGIVKKRKGAAAAVQEIPTVEVKGPSYKQIIKNTVNPPHEPMIPTETRIVVPSPSAAPKKTTHEFKVGDHLKQVKPYLGRTVSTICVVTALVNGLVEVNAGGNQYYKISPDCLEIT